MMRMTRKDDSSVTASAMHTPGYTRLEATHIAEGARDAWTAAINDSQDCDPHRVGRVLRIFDRTAYLVFDEGTRPLPPVLMLGTATVPEGPLLTRTDTGAGFVFPDVIDQGDDCRVRPMAESGNRCMLSVGPVLDVEMPPEALEPAMKKPPCIRPLETIGSEGPVYQRSRALLRDIQEAGMVDGLGWLKILDGTTEPSSHQHVQEVIETWIAILKQEQPQPVDIAPITRLLGLGPGTTPSGDDILSGILYTLTRTTHGETREVVEDAAERLIRQSRSATTTVSLALLEQAAKGRAPAAVENCLTALLETASQATCRRAANAMADIGHYSGTDALAGILVTLLGIAPRIGGDRTSG